MATQKHQVRHRRPVGSGPRHHPQGPGGRGRRSAQLNRGGRSSSCPGPPRPGRAPSGPPLPTELVDTAYDFAAELLKAQREFFHKAIEVTTPLYERPEEQGTKAAKSVKS